ncbi:MAG TPA: GxxExxY protein [Phycisphaerales bacterium]|nr:GxxExxY protein [Phycisphaerales bacterium]HCD31498.1 GxxExxY protein [Phycisphaerales bacterium]|tara:strand:+ start:2084 stop:2497 length:414 start_codon:yes stop_codon:yes gene_type:complete
MQQSSHDSGGVFSLDSETELLAKTVISAAIEVHRTLGPGFLESVYEAALCAELNHRNIPHVCQAVYPVLYKGKTIGEHRLDIVVDHKIIIELKAVEKLSPVHSAQLLSYLKATEMRLGLLMNFNDETLKAGLKRIVL